MKNKIIVLISLIFFLVACSPPLPEGEGIGGRVTTPTPLATPLPASTIPTATVFETSTPEAVLSSPIALTTAAPANERTSTIDGMPQVYVPAGILRMGGLDVHADDRDELPAHTVSLDAFWIDQLEVTNAVYMLCVQAGDCTPPMDWASNEHPSYFNNAEFKDYPVVHVTWQQAKTYCRWAGRRLPTEAEWERAARGDDFRNFPWGDAPPSAAYANFNYLAGEISRVGSYPAGASPFGALDMAGNIWEWVADLYEVEYYKISPEHNPPGPATNTTNLRVIRGGSYQDDWVNLRVSKRGAAFGPDQDIRDNDEDNANEHSSKIGFRCVADE
jgi:serine/threonine-protein kinase